MGDQQKQRASYEFLREYALSGEVFSNEDINTRMGWKGQTGKTYRSKHWDAYLERVSPGTYRVLPEFKRVSWDEFQDLVTQVRHPFASYDRATYHNVVVYDFLMPLTREDKLRKALDELFYRDTLERRIQEIGLGVMAKTIPRSSSDTDLEYVDKIIAFIGDRIGGFSISHVSGRFRVGDILSRKDSAEQLALDKPYLIDETTAVVRFIIPCISSKVAHGADFDLSELKGERPKALEYEVAQIRTVFFELFVEALVPTIRGEKLIWMLETGPTGQRLYELDLVKPKAKAGGNDDDDEDTNGEEGGGSK